MSDSRSFRDLWDEGHEGIVDVPKVPTTVEEVTNQFHVVSLNKQPEVLEEVVGKPIKTL